MSNGSIRKPKTLREFVELLKENSIKEGTLPRVRFSGCPNSCGMHEIGDIGFAGKKKKFVMLYQMYLNYILVEN